MPLMFRFKRHSEEPQMDLVYDDAAQLNLAVRGTALVPAIFCPDTLADMKTVRRSEGAGED
jgi:hypothetical protein